MGRIGAVTVDGDMPDFRDVSQKMPFFSRRVLFEVGQIAAKQLYRGALRGILRPRSFSGHGTPISPAGRRMVSYSVDRAGKAVIVRSFPMNIYRARGETGPRSAPRTAGRMIFRSFESGFNLEAAAAVGVGNALRAGGVFNPKNGEGWSTRLKKTKGGGREGVIR